MNGNRLTDQLQIDDGVIPDGRYKRYRNSDKGKQRDARRTVARRDRSIESYLSREFVAWDGEGGDDAEGTHTYFLLASSAGASISDPAGLSTRDVFDLWLQSRTGVTNVIYGGGYDTNMCLRDVPRVGLETLYRTGRVTWNGYALEWRAGKSFRVSRGGKSFTLYDVLPFFQKPFVDACDEYLGNWDHRELVVREKARRGQFDWSEIEVIREYNRYELDTLVNLCNELRQRLYRVGIRVSRWDGPGAIATALYQKHGVKSCLGEIPSAVGRAARHGYAGGRFEIIRKGHSIHGAYQYDINSAYPHAIRFLPCLAHGEWTHVRRATDIAHYGIYRIEITEPITESVTQPHPLWMRNHDGTVYFSETAHGWYWSPEAKLVVGKPNVEIHEGWEYHTACNCEPFGFVENLYRKRAALKKANDGAHIGIKLGLNSLYGKLAQQIGWDAGPPLRLPPYHSLEWAGWITSHCRAQVYNAAMRAPDDIIAFETDAVFSRVPLELDIGDGLGQWGETVYDSLTYLKSGMYWATRADGKEVEKCRGINRGTLTRADVIDGLSRAERGEDVILEAEQTRFIGLGAALHTTFDNWRTWKTAPRLIRVTLDGKRIDLLSREDVRKDLCDGWSETQDGFPTVDFSAPYEIAWLDELAIAPNGLSYEENRLLDCHADDYST